MALKKRKIIDYTLNAFLIGIVLLMFVPSWRIAFQGWFQGLFMSEVTFAAEISQPVSKDALQWAMFDMNNRLYSFEDFNGKPVVLSFWATWCPPCRAELPELKKLKSDLHNVIHVIAVTEESVDVVAASNLHNDYDFLYSTPKIPSFYNVQSYPTLLILDNNMNIVFRNEGAGDLYTEPNKIFLQTLARET